MTKSLNHKGIYLQLHILHDADILCQLSKCENKQGYIKELIRSDISGKGANNDKNRSYKNRDTKGSI